jgi:hypothetical protein
MEATFHSAVRATLFDTVGGVESEYVAGKHCQKTLCRASPASHLKHANMVLTTFSVWRHHIHFNLLLKSFG